jgi:beta-xylosidase
MYKMNTMLLKKTCLALILFFNITIGIGQTSENKLENYQQVNTYTNPVLPGDHPDPTLLKVGNDFYHCGSSFHFNPYLPIYHSTDLVHWEIISRVVSPTKAASFVADRPSGGIWQGAITYFYGSYWIYFSSGGQWFCKADHPKGPWTDPVKVKENPITGPLGYDNSIFVEEDGKPYMIIKNGQKTNRIQALGKDGQLADTVINLDWVNANLQYSWAEGPVMCKRNGYYFYLPAGDVTGGQYVLRFKELTSDSTKWERLGNFFKPITDPTAGFRRPNHIAAPLQLADGTWWTIGQSYEKYEGDDWSGAGRQTSLYPVTWEADRPWGMAPTNEPIIKPNLPKSNILWRAVQSDDFDQDVLGLKWHFLNRKAANNYSLTARKGWIRLNPDTSRTHIVQKETDHYYSAITKMEFDATDSSAKAGMYLTNGNQKLTARIYSGYENGKKIIFQLDTATRLVENKIGHLVWFKLERREHLLFGFYSKEGKNWLSMGAPFNLKTLDQTQPNYNSWVGTSVGLFAEGKSADFDVFICKDAFSPIVAAGFSNNYGIKKIWKENEMVATTNSSNGGWLMISGVEFGKTAPSSIAINASSIKNGQLEIWIDDLKSGKLIATVSITNTGQHTWKTFSKSIQKITGQHDVFIKYPKLEEGNLLIRNIQFSK